MQNAHSAQAPEHFTVTVTLFEPGASPERLDELTVGVRRELLNTGVDSVSFAPGAPAPAGARSVDPTAVGELVVVLGSSSALIQSVIGVLKAWRDRYRPRSVVIKIDDRCLDLSDATEMEQQRLVSAFIRSLSRQE
jgi:hypothetical protein